MLAARGALATIAIELAVRVQVISFQIAIDTLASRACGPAPRGGFDHDERGFILLGNLCRREPGLLQRGVLAEQRFLQRPSHTFSLISVKFPGPSAQHSQRHYRDGHSPPSLIRSSPPIGRLQRYSITRTQGYARLLE
jgi:hypothetical protein